MDAVRSRRVRRRTFVIALSALTAGLFVAGPAARHADAAVGPLTFADEFDGAAGTGPNSSRWRQDTGGGGFGNNELQYYTSGSNTSSAAT